MFHSVELAAIPACCNQQQDGALLQPWSTTKRTCPDLCGMGACSCPNCWLPPQYHSKLQLDQTTGSVYGALPCEVLISASKEIHSCADEDATGQHTANSQHGCLAVIGQQHMQQPLPSWQKQKETCTYDSLIIAP